MSESTAVEAPAAKEPFFKMSSIPGANILVPLLLGCLLNTLFPDLFKTLGSFTLGMTQQGAGPLVGAFLLIVGTTISFKSAPAAAARGAIIIAVKQIVVVAVSLLILYVFNDNLFGISAMVMLAACTGANNAMYAGLMGTMGNEAERGAVAITTLVVGPPVTMIVLGAAGDDIAKELLPEAVKRGAVVVDNSHAFRMDPEVPLVVPEINADDIKWHHGLIANPNCATIIGLVPTWPLHQLAGVKRMIVSTYQAASGAGAPGMAELEAQLATLGRGEEIPEPRAFAAQLASNLIPQIGGVKEEGFTSEEMKLQNEGRKIMHLPELRVNCTCVRVPVLRSHSESITLEFERDITVEEARAALAAAPGVKLVDDMSAEDAHDRFPMPMDTSDQDLIWVGRVRRDISNPEATRGITFWCCGDQIRKGAATNAVQIAKLLCE